MAIDPNMEGVEAWELSTPSAPSEGGERVAFDERPTLEIQLDIERLATEDARQRRIWLLGLLALAVVLVVVPADAGLAFGGIAAAVLGTTAIGFLRVRRRQLRAALEGELEARRRLRIREGGDLAGRLVALRDELDRRADRPSGWTAILLSAAAAVAFLSLGLAETVQLGVALGGFFGLFTILSLRDEMRATAERRELESEVRAIEGGGTDGGRHTPREG